MEATVIAYRERGKPADVLSVETRDISDPQAGEVRIRLLAATINPSDLGMIGGTYGRLPDLPAVAGREGVGEVEAIGPEVAGLTVGTRVRMPEALGVWRSHVIAPAEGLVVIPADVPPKQAAMAFINPPTSLLILKQFVNLQPGDWVMQNASNSVVGQAYIQIAREMGLKTLNVVRDAEKWEQPLRDLGADVVVAEESGYEKKITDLCSGQRPRLALNSIGGMSVVRLVRSLAEGGTCVTIGGMVGEAIRYPTRDLIFNDVILRGFWMDRWNRENSPAVIATVQNRIFELMATKKLNLLEGSVFPLDRIAEAVTTAQESARMGKVLLVP